MLEKREKTLKKHKYLEAFATLEVMKECEFDREYDETTVHAKYLTQTDTLEGVRGGGLFGAIVCDVCVPNHLKHAFAEMPPIFKNVDILINDVGPYIEKPV